MKIMKFGDFASFEIMNEDDMADNSYSTANSENAFKLKGSDVEQSYSVKGTGPDYTFIKDSVMFDFTDLYVNFVNKNV